MTQTFTPMDQDFTTEVNLDHTNVFKRLTRYSIKPPGIIIDRHAPRAVGEPTIDPDGEWMKCDQLNNLIALGGLLEMSQPLSDLIDDGKSHQAFIRDVTALGYDNFDQIMEVLKKNREHVIQHDES